MQKSESDVTNAMPNPQADSMIESGRPWNEVIPLFPTKISAYEYFAGSMARRFASADSHCAACGRQCDTAPIAFTWRANLHTVKTVLVSFLITAITIFGTHLYSRWVVVEFTTFHRLCPACRRRHRIRGFAVALLQHLLFAALILLVILTVPSFIFLFLAIFAMPECRWQTFGISLIGVLLLGLVMWGFAMSKRFLIPESLRQIGRFPFFLHGLRDAA